MSIPFERSFASHEKSVFWSSKNEKNPSEVSKSSNKKYLFDCGFCNHEFSKSLDKVVIDNGWCPYCAIPSKKLCDSSDCKLCFDKSFASHEKSAFWSNKNECKPRDVFKSSHKIYLFDCHKCKHVNNISLANVTRGNWCSYCSNQKLCDSGDCQLCFSKSFASHEKAVFWSSKNDCQQRDVFKSSGNYYLFDCVICNHDFEMGLHSINSNTWCPYCAIPSKKLCDSSDCKLCFDKSFASHEKSQFWSSKNECKPRDVFKSSGKKYEFNCTECSHINNISLLNVTHGNWCSYCSNQKLCDSNDCQLCFDKSFASNKKSRFWSSKNDCQPRDVFKSSGKKYWFDCNKCNNDFTSALDCISRGTWCPFCINKTEAKLYEIMKQLYLSLITQFKQEWCKKILHLPYDFCIPEYKIIIELDGAQHFRQVSNWSSPEEQFENDKYKEECANQNGYSVIRLLQEDVFYDTYDWVKELTEAIEEIKSSEGITNIYLCKNGEYDNY